MDNKHSIRLQHQNMCKVVRKFCMQIICFFYKDKNEGTQNTCIRAHFMRIENIFIALL